MKIINPDDEKELKNFYQEWYSCYTSRNPVEPPSIATMRILYQYATDGGVPGDYITAILQNDLYGVYGCAPLEELPLIYGTVQYVAVRMDVAAYGSSEKVGKWINKQRKEKNGRKTTMY